MKHIKYSKYIDDRVAVFEVIAYTHKEFKFNFPAEGASKAYSVRLIIKL